MDNLLRCSINPDTDRAAKFVRTKGLVILNGFLKSLSELLFGSEYRGALSDQRRSARPVGADVPGQQAADAVARERQDRQVV